MRLFKSSAILLVVMVFISMFMAFPIFPAAAQEYPRLEVRPSVIEGNEGDDVAIEIWATNVDEALEIIGFEFSVLFETEWLAPEEREKGTFMEEFVDYGELNYPPGQNPLYTVVSDIPYKPNLYLTKAMVMILPDPETGEHCGIFPGANGITEGRLVTLHYTALESNVAMPIFIIDITILDRYEGEVPYEPPSSGLYKAGDISGLNVELSGWKFKVNGKAGVGLGHKSTVGEENTFEVQVTNTGTIDACVGTTFEIMSPAAGAKVVVIAVLPAGQSTVLSATWTAPVPGLYEIFGIVAYGPPGYSTRTQTLRIDVKPK